MPANPVKKEPTKKKKRIPPPGRFVTHVKIACDNCRRWRTRCSGYSPCEECEKRGKKDSCYFQPPTTKSAATNFGSDYSELHTRGSDGSSGSTGSNSTDSQDNNSSSVTVTKRNGAAISAERLLADDTTAKFLMDIFIRRIHPHTLFMTSTSPAHVFENVLNNQAMKPSDAIQRDAGLAMACRMCGHEALGSLLLKRMEMNYERIKDEPISQDAYSAMALLSTIVLSENISKGTEMSRWSFSMHRSLYPATDPISSACEFLETLSISSEEGGSGGGGGGKSSSDDSRLVGIQLAELFGCNEANGMYNDWTTVSKEEITAHVQMATSQLVNWSQTLPDMQLRQLVALFAEMATRIALPSVRPAQTIYFSLYVDLHLLGCLISPFVMEIFYRHDPENKFGMSALFKPCEALEDVPEPSNLSEEIAASLLRRVLVCRMLLFESGIDMEVVSSYITCIEIIEIGVQWWSGNREKAAKIGQWLFRFIEHQDLNFWNPMISQNLLMLGSIFFEMRDRLGLMQTIGVLEKLRRSQPTVVIGIDVLRELQSTMVE